ncbi:nanos 1 isoform X2 [Biomphalaria glabrata]|nr:nanos 1 isoform X2 [Biomphalaria glabrata]
MEVFKDLGYHSEHNISPPSTGMITQNSSSNNEGNVPTSSTSKQDYPGQTCETSKKSSVPVQEGRMNNPTFVQFRRRQPVGRPIVGRPPIPPPIDPIAETMAYTQLWYSWESLNSINSNIGHFDLIKEFDDLCNLYHSCEGEQNMNMSSYIKMVLDMKAKRSTEKFNNFSEAVSKLDREQAELVEFLSAHSIEVHPICNSAGMPAFKNSKQIPKYPSSAFSPSVVTMSERKFPATLNECEDQILEITRFKMPDDEITWVGLKMLDSVM